MCRKSGDNPFLRARKRLILGRDDSLGWNINRIPEPFTGEVVLPEQADVGRWDDGVVGNGSPDLRFDLIGGGLVDARSDARDPIEPCKLIFKIRREIIIKMTAPALWVRILRMITYSVLRLPARRTGLSAVTPQRGSAPVSIKRVELNRSPRRLGYGR
jgi:hypothetical protein